MPGSPLISVCTPVYNGEEFLQECIEGVLAQRYKNFEYIIVDNASTDRTAEIIEKFSAKDSRVKAFRNDSTVNVIDNFRTCAEHCSDEARWIKYALADDYLHHNCLEEMLAVGQMSDDVGLVSAYRLYGTSLTNAGLPVNQSVFKGADILKRQLLRQLHVCSGSPNTVMYRKSAFEAVGGFDNSYLHADSELAMRLLDNYDLGFAHCVFTRTGLHGGREETRSIYNGLVIREYLEFGFKKLQNYKSVEFSQQELDGLAGFYAKQVNEFIAKKLSHLELENIRVMLASCPDEVRGRLWSAFGTAPVKILKAFKRELVRVMRRSAPKPASGSVKRKR
jgi:glycosyltransferase involved in cell wall biosynthesis